jgi:hypothetical protein
MFDNYISATGRLLDGWEDNRLPQRQNDPNCEVWGDRGPGGGWLGPHGQGFPSNVVTVVEERRRGSLKKTDGNAGDLEKWI